MLRDKVKLLFCVCVDSENERLAVHNARCSYIPVSARVNPCFACLARSAVVVQIERDDKLPCFYFCYRCHVLYSPLRIRARIY